MLSGPARCEEARGEEAVCEEARRRPFAAAPCGEAVQQEQHKGSGRGLTCLITESPCMMPVQLVQFDMIAGYDRLPYT